MLRRLGPLVAVPLVLATPLAAQEPATAFRDVRVFDGERVIERATVVVRGGRVEAVGPAVRVPAGAAVVEGAGRTLLPALIDAHTHSFAPAMLQAALAFGVGTQFEMFTAAQLAAAWRREQQATGAPERADVLSAGILATAPGGHGTQFGMAIPTVASPAQADSFVAARVAEGSDYLKIVVDDGAVYGIRFNTLDEATVRALVEAAHRRGKMAVVHVGTLADARTAVRAGADGLVHAWVDSVPEPGLVREMARRRVFVVPTLTVLESVTGTAGGAALLRDARFAAALGPDESESLRRAFPTRPGATASYDAARRTVAALRAAGVRILAGSDAPNPGTTHGASIHRELELLVQAGLTPVEALRAATSVPAGAFGLGDRGVIAPGMRADLLLVEGNPAADVTATRAIAGVWKAGRRLDRDAFLAAVAARRQAAAAGPPAPGGVPGRVSGFDDGAPAAAFGAGWTTTTDAMMGGQSTAALEVAPGGAGGTSHALRVRGELRQGGAAPQLWAGAIFYPGERQMSPANLSAAQGFRFHARGDGRTYLVMVFSAERGMTPVFRPVTVGAEWAEHVFRWSDFEGIDGSRVLAIAVVAAPPAGAFELWLDEVELR